MAISSRHGGYLFAELTSILPERTRGSMTGHAMSEASAWAVGEAIERAYVVEKIHHGGMATVYIVFDSQHDERLAVKAPRQDLGATPHILRRFLHEAETWISLGEHPNVVRARFVSRTTASHPLLFLEYVEGTTLRSLVDLRVPNLLLLLDIGIQIANGLAYAAMKGGLLHRDIKPENILVTPELLAKVTDFGVARALTNDRLEPPGDSDEGDSTLTRHGELVGTLPYMSLEQLRSKPELDARADVYSFGVVLYELLTGHLPYQAKIPSPSTSDRFRKTVYAWAHAQETRPPSLHTASPYPIPLELDALVLACLAPDRASRPASFEEVRSALLTVYDGILAASGQAPLARILVEQGIDRAQAGDHEEAIRYYDGALAIHPRSGEAWHNKATALSNMADREAFGAPQPLPGIKGHTEHSDLLFQSAIRCSERSVELEPDFAYAWNTKGSALLETRRHHAALECFDRAIALLPNYGTAWYNRGTCLRRLDRRQDALASYDHALEINPRHANAWAGKASCLAELERFDESIVCFETAIAIDPHHPSAGNLLALTKLRRRWRRIVKAPFRWWDWIVRRFRRKPKPIVPMRRAANARAARDRMAAELGDRAWSLKNLGRLDEALEAAVASSRIDLEYSTAYLQQGRILRLMGRSAEALAAYDRALALDASYTLVWLNRGVALVDLERHREADAEFDRYIHAVPDDPSGWENKGFLRTRSKDWHDALRCFDEALRIDPNKATLHFNRAATLLELSEKSAAAAAAKRATELDPLNAGAWVLRGRIALLTNHARDALGAFDRALRIDASSGDTWILKGMALVELRENPHAMLECSRKAAELGGPRDQAVMMEARAYYEMHEYEMSAAIYEQIVAAEPDRADGWVLAAAAYAQIDRWKDAARCQIRAVRLMPEDFKQAELASSFFQHAYPEIAAQCERGMKLAQGGDLKRGLDLLGRAIKDVPEWWELREQRGGLLMSAQRFDEAAEDFTAALKITTSLARTWSALGICRCWSGKFAEAVDALQRAVELDASLAEAWFCRGFALRELGRDQEAHFCFARATALNPALQEPRRSH
jgi:tetratricopeptide (TPR) repeat protein